MIKACNLKIAYDKWVIVEDFDFEIRRGEIVSLIGPNGSGKSTVLKAVSRLMKSKEGVVYLDGRDIYTLPTREVARKLSILPQSHTAPPDFTVEQLVSYGRMPHLKWYETKGSDDNHIVRWAMEAANITHLSKRSINSLSGGEKQRAWIAVALAQNPKVLLLDEPTTYLDICHQFEVLELIKRLNTENGLTIAMVLHDLTHAANYSHRVVAIKGGRKIAEGSPEQVITSGLLREVYNVEAEIIRGGSRHSLAVLPVGLSEKSLKNTF